MMRKAIALRDHVALIFIQFFIIQLIIMIFLYDIIAINESIV